LASARDSDRGQAAGGTLNTPVRIGEAARMVGVSPSTLRAWERAGWLQPDRGRGRHRLYSRRDLERLTEMRPLIQPRLRRLALRRRLAAPNAAIEDLAGPRFRALRARRGVSLRTLAREASVSPAYLSLIERGLATPTVAVLQRIAAAMSVTVLQAFGEDGLTAKLVRAGDRRPLPGFNGVDIQDLVQFPNAVLQIEIFTVAPGGGSGGAYRHQGEEAIFVLEGELQVWLDETEHYHLATGDLLYFRSDQAHRWQNPGADPARLFWVNTPPTF